jgi:hypothetical protein
MLVETTKPASEGASAESLHPPQPSGANSSAHSSYRIAIQPDRIRHKNGEDQSYSARWAELAAERGIEVIEVDIGAPGFFERLARCDGFMWRFGYDPLSLQLAKRLLPAVEQGMRVPVFPSWRSAWHFEDKVGQHYLMRAAAIPAPRTWIWWRRGDAVQFCRDAQYPLVAKLASGFQSNNVRLLCNFGEARELIDQIFGAGLMSLEPPRTLFRQLLRKHIQGLRLLAGKPLPRGTQHGYLYVQEFLAGNAFDTRVTVIGNRAFAFRRFNRPDDFRASGSGRIDWDPRQIDMEIVQLAFSIARQLHTQSVAIDALRRGCEHVVSEISYTYASWAVRDCPGHWVLEGEPYVGCLRWREGKLRPEDAIFADFLEMLKHHRQSA